MNIEEEKKMYLSPLRIFARLRARKKLIFGTQGIQLGVCFGGNRNSLRASRRYGFSFSNFYPLCLLPASVTPLNIGKKIMLLHVLPPLPSY